MKLLRGVKIRTTGWVVRRSVLRIANRGVSEECPVSAGPRVVVLGRGHESGGMHWRRGGAMREILGNLIIGLLLTSGGNLSAGPLEDGIAAYQRGDFATALRLFQPLAEQGDASAQSNLGMMYEQGRGVAQNYREAMRWFRLAAMQGDASAQSNLGVMYYTGQGIAQDFREAMRWYRLGAGQGNAEAQFNLGVMYEQGRGVPQDLLRAHM